MICPVTDEPEMFLFTDTKFKQELNAQNINTKQLKNPPFPLVEDGGIVCPTIRKSNQCLQRRAQPWAGLDKGWIGAYISGGSPPPRTPLGLQRLCKRCWLSRRGVVLLLFIVPRLCLRYCVATKANSPMGTILYNITVQCCTIEQGFPKWVPWHPGVPQE